MTLKAKLFSQASQFAELQALLGSSPSNFRWFDVQLPQAQATFPAVTVNQIGAPRMYVTNGRLSTYFARVQFTIYGSGNDSQNAAAVTAALEDFLAVFNATAVQNAPTYPNTIVGDKDFGIAATQPLTYMRVIDAMIFNDENA
jgi:hypothetical protein